MKRRAFLQRICAGIVGAAAIAKIPASWIPSSIVSVGNGYAVRLTCFRDLSGGNPRYRGVITNITEVDGY